MDTKKYCLLVIFFLFALFLLARAETVFCQPNAGYSLVFLQKTETKNFCFLSLLRHLNESENILLNDNELLVKAWEQDAQSIHRIINIYGEGQKPLYPNMAECHVPEQAIILDPLDP